MMFNEHSDDNMRNSAFRKIDNQKTDYSNFQLNGFSVTNEMMTVINAQNILIMKLLQRQNVLYQQLNKKLSGSESAEGSSDNRKNQQIISGYKEFKNLEQFSSSSNGSNDVKNLKHAVKIIQKQNNNPLSHKFQRNVQFSGQLNSSEEEEVEKSKGNPEKNNEKKKQTQTKNMVKNFAKAIFHYIRKNKQSRDKVLKMTQISEEEFLKVYEHFRGKIHSISQLRALWTVDGNKCHKAFRILSANYLRKYCLERTFNSRVENYSVHLKYRQRLLQGIRNPEEFTALKTN